MILYFSTGCKLQLQTIQRELFVSTTNLSSLIFVFICIICSDSSLPLMRTKQIFCFSAFFVSCSSFVKIIRFSFFAIKISLSSSIEEKYFESYPRILSFFAKLPSIASTTKIGLFVLNRMPLHERLVLCDC